MGTSKSTTLHAILFSVESYVLRFLFTRVIFVDLVLCRLKRLGSPFPVPPFYLVGGISLHDASLSPKNLSLAAALALAGKISHGNQQPGNEVPRHKASELPSVSSPVFS